MSAQVLTPEERLQLPAAVQAALTSADAWIGKRFAGRRVVPKPYLAQLDVPDLQDTLYAVLVPPGGVSSQRIQDAGLRFVREKSAEALQAQQDVLLVETCFWAGLSDDQSDDGAKDPRVAARNWLKELREEAGALGQAWGAIAAAALDLLEQPEVRLGKLGTSRTG